MSISLTLKPQRFFEAEDVATGDLINQVAIAEMETQPWLVHLLSASRDISGAGAGSEPGHAGLSHSDCRRGYHYRYIYG